MLTTVAFLHGLMDILYLHNLNQHLKHLSTTSCLVVFWKETLHTLYFLKICLEKVTSYTTQTLPLAIGKKKLKLLGNHLLFRKTGPNVSGFAYQLSANNELF